MFFQAEEGIGGVERSRGLGEVYKRQARDGVRSLGVSGWIPEAGRSMPGQGEAPRKGGGGPHRY